MQTRHKRQVYTSDGIYQLADVPTYPDNSIKYIKTDRNYMVRTGAVVGYNPKDSLESEGIADPSVNFDRKSCIETERHIIESEIAGIPIEDSTALRVFMAYFTPFLEHMKASMNEYYKYCAINRETPVKHLNVYYKRLYKSYRNRKYKAKPFQPESELASFSEQIEDSIVSKSMSIHPSNVQSSFYVAGPQAIPMLLPCNLDPALKMNPSHESLSVVDHSLMSGASNSSNDSELVPIFLNSFPFPKDRKHTKQWKDVTAMELIFYCICLLLGYEGEKQQSDVLSTIPGYQSREEAKPSSTSGNKSIVVDFIPNLTSAMSRDRFSQIRRYLYFQDVDMDSKKVFDEYEVMQVNEKCKEYSVSIHSVCDRVYTDYEEDMKTILSILNTNVFLSIYDILGVLKYEGIEMEASEVEKMKSFQQYHRYTDQILVFVMVLIIRATKIRCCSLHSIKEENMPTDLFMNRLLKSLLFFFFTDKTSYLSPDVHYLKEYGRNSNNNMIRRLCANCCEKDNGKKKRTTFYCAVCKKSFCNNGQCFPLFHKSNGLNYYCDQMIV